MSYYSATDLKINTKIIIDQSPCIIIYNEFVKPGKGQAFNRIKYKNLKTNKIIEKTFKSNESVKSANIVNIEIQFLYTNNNIWFFMNLKSYEQYEINENIIKDTKKWLTNEDICLVTLWDNTPIQIIPPNFVILKIIDTTPSLKGDTISGGNKNATLSTGAVIKVPVFIQINDFIKIDTRVGAYVSKSK